MKNVNHAVKGMSEIEAKIGELQQFLTPLRNARTAEEAKEMRRAQHQIYVLQWAIGQHDDATLDWVSTALGRLEQAGPEARDLLAPWLIEQR